MTRVRAQSWIEVQLCGTSSGEGAYARFPASSGVPITVDRIEFASM